MANCSPQALTAQAACFLSCTGKVQLRAIKNYLLCQITLAGGIGQNLVPNGSVYGGGASPEFDLTVLSNTVYNVCWGSNELSMTIGSSTYQAQAGHCIAIYTGSNTVMKFIGNSAGTTVTVRVVRSGSIPAPGDFTLADNSGTITASWDAIPTIAGTPITQTEVWTSTDNVTFTLAGTVAAPGTSLTLATPSGSVLYAKARWDSGLSFIGPFSPVVTLTPPLQLALQSYWKLDEAITSGTRVDAMGLNNLTDEKTDIGFATGIIGDAASIPSGRQGDALDHVDTASLAAGSGVSFSISTWLYITAVIANQPFLSKWAATSDFLLWPDAGNSKISFSARNLANNATAEVQTTTATLNVWTHVACGYDDSLQQIWIQLNGGARVSAACVGVQRTAAPFTLFGYAHSLNNSNFAGRIDETGFWHRSLSTADVARLYNSGAALAFPLW